jgi:hypothetical protein
MKFPDNEVNVLVGSRADDHHGCLTILEIGAWRQPYFARDERELAPTTISTAPTTHNTAGMRKIFWS